MPSGISLGLPRLTQFLLINIRAEIELGARHTLLNRRLVAIDIGNYAIGHLARFASSCAISTNQHSCDKVSGR